MKLKRISPYRIDPYILNFSNFRGNTGTKPNMIDHDKKSFYLPWLNQQMPVRNSFQTGIVIFKMKSISEYKAAISRLMMNNMALTLLRYSAKMRVNFSPEVMLLSVLLTV